MGTFIDIAIGSILFIALIVGAVKGFAKQFSSFATVIGTLVGSIVLAGFIAGLAMKAEFIYATIESMGGWFSGIPGAATPVFTLEELTAALSSGAFKFLVGSAESIWLSMVNYYVFTIGEYFSYLIIQAAVFLILFIVSYIFISNLFKALSHLLKKIGDALKPVDRILGAAWSLLVAYILIVAVGLTGTEIVLSLYFADTLPAFLSTVSKSFLLTIAHNTNFIGAILANLLGYTLPELPAAESAVTLTLTLAC